jgi:membrane associated rhomboid family serine protease
MFPRLTGVVKNLIIINVIVYLGAMLLESSAGIPRQILYMWPPNSLAEAPWGQPFQPFQIVSHMFMHGGTSHILFNMLTLYFLGPMVEMRIGHKKFLILYMLSGFGALLLHILLVYMPLGMQGVPVVGASGAVYGVLIAFAYLFPDMKLMLLFPPIPIKAKYLALGLIVFGLFAGTTGVQQGVAHWAHLGGALTAFIILVVWKNSGKLYG